MQNTPGGLRGKAIATRSFLLITGRMMRFTVQMAVIVIYARTLPVSDYGLYQSIWLFINVISIISLFGLPSLLPSSPTVSIQKWLRQNIMLVLSVGVILNVAPLLYILIGAGEYDSITRWLLIALIIIQNISIVTEAIAIKNEKEKSVVAANFIFSVGFLTCHLVVLYTGYSLSMLVAALVLIFAIKSAVLFIGPEKKNNPAVAAAVPQLGRQWLYLGMNDVMGVIAVWLDKWVIFLLLPVSQFAVYFNGAYEIPVFGIMLSAVGNIMLVEFSKRAGNDADNIRFLFGSSAMLLAALVFPSFCFLLLNHDAFFTLIFGTKYTASIPIFFVSIFILPVRIIFSTTLLQVYHRSDLIFKGTLLDVLLAVMLMIIFYPIFQMKGLALAFVISTYVQAGFYLWQTGRLLKKRVSYFFPFAKLAALMLITAVISGMGFLIFRMMPPTENLICGMILCAVLIMTTLRYVYRKEFMRH